MAATHVALLRGINVGGNNKLPMADLAELFEAAGCRDVSTYIQSGNVRFRATAALARRVPTAIAAAIAKHHALDVPVLVRTVDDLARVVAENPYLHAKAVTTELYVAFLAAAPSAKAIATLDPARSPPDEFTVRGTEIYLRYPRGAGRTKLTNAYFDAKLATTSTVRNWNTVLALASG